MPSNTERTRVITSFEQSNFEHAWLIVLGYHHYHKTQGRYIGVCVCGIFCDWMFPPLCCSKRSSVHCSLSLKISHAIYNIHMQASWKQTYLICATIAQFFKSQTEKTQVYEMKRENTKTNGKARTLRKQQIKWILWWFGVVNHMGDVVRICDSVSFMYACVHVIWMCELV